MTIFVTGGAGFIGSALVRQLIAAGDSVVTIDKLTYAGNLENLSGLDGTGRHRFVQADICDVDAMRGLFAEHRPDIVYHLAAESHVDRSIDDPLAFVRTNVLGTAALLTAALDHWRGLPKGNGFRFLHVSTDEVYGELDATGLFSEASPYQPNSPYSSSKASSDHLARAWHRTYGLPVMVSNCSNNYGPYQYPEKLIPVVALNALEGKALPIYGKGENVRDWIHVDDHAAGLRAIMARGRLGETYLVGSRSERTNIDLVRQICRILDELQPAAQPYESLITHVTDRPGHDARYAIDPTKAETELGWRPRHSLEDGLRETIAWYIANRDWCARAGERSRIGLGHAA
ncbi:MULTISPECIES: dTDP-glucose 4,6-dehydratase [unclassified Inquilinus]|uniref:dTDP-glucose 4,6-dehydratase n=1 Tax=unclassified Inquilinus TaxID=2645927 RepID=UPI003F90FA05